jgi:hypothetical protein
VATNGKRAEKSARRARPLAIARLLHSYSSSVENETSSSLASPGQNRERSANHVTVALPALSVGDHAL